MFCLNNNSIEEKKRNEENKRNEFPMIEALLFAMGCPVEISKLCEVMEIPSDDFNSILKEFCEYINKSSRGVKVVRMNNSVQMVSRPKYHEMVAKLLETKSQRNLSQSALETLSIIAYNQPVTKTNVESVRGVDCYNSIMRLLERDLIEQRGRLDTIGRPMLYGTTEEFLRVFGLESLNELPDLGIDVLSSITPHSNNLTFDDILENDL